MTSSEIKSSPETAFIRNPEVRVRMNPDTYLRFDGTDKVYIQNVHCMEGVSIKYDILLILYELVEWKTIAELIEPWPPGDQEMRQGWAHSWRGSPPSTGSAAAPTRVAPPASGPLTTAHLPSGDTEMRSMIRRSVTRWRPLPSMATRSR